MDDEIGKNPPYLVYDKDSLYLLPTSVVCRDNNLAYELTESMLEDLIDSGWANCFDACAIFKTSTLKSRSVVVVRCTSPKGFKKFFWFLRLNFLSTSNGREGNTVHSGRSILWPVPPLHALEAQSVWKTHGALANRWVFLAKSCKMQLMMWMGPHLALNPQHPNGFPGPEGFSLKSTRALGMAAGAYLLCTRIFMR